MCAQVAAAHHLQEVTRKTVEGRAKLGVTAFAEALLGIPKILAENSGYDAQVSASRASRQLSPQVCPYICLLELGSGLALRVPIGRQECCAGA